MSLVTLARQILKDAEALEADLKSAGAPICTFDPGSPPAIPIQFMQAQQAMLANIEELQAMTAGPLQHLMRTISPVQNVLVVVQVISRHEIAHRLGRDEEVDFATLAERCGLPATDLTRVLRMAIANRIFAAPRAGRVRHNATSLLFLDVPGLESSMRVFTDEVFPAMARTADAMARWPASEEPDETGFALTTTGNTPLSFFDVLKAAPDRRRRFDEFMRFLFSTPDLHPAFLLDNLDWGRKPEDGGNCPALVVDMGGSSGHIAKAILERFPVARCIVQDLPEAAAAGEVPASLEGRLEFQAHSLFDRQPVEADVYFIRSVLHDFSDKYAARILAAIVPAMKPGSKIILNEACLAEMGKLPKYAEQYFRGFDLTMKSLFNSLEREMDDWKRVIKAAHTDLQITSVKIIPGSALAIMEVTKIEKPTK